MEVTSHTWNLLQMSLGLMLIFLAFFSQSFIEETVLHSRSKVDPSIAPNAGYLSQTIIYGTFLFSNLVAPPLVGLMGCRWSLVAGSATYTVLMAGFLFLNSPFLYISSALEGFGSAILWTAVGHYLALNSNELNIGRNSSIVWMWHTSGLIFGGIFLLVVFGFTPDRDIDESLTRFLPLLFSFYSLSTIYGVFTAVAFLGNLVFFFLRTPKEEIDYQKQSGSYREELLSTFKLLFTLDMALLSITSAFAGQEMSFWSGVYGTSLAFTKAFTINTKMLVAYNSIAAGIGQIGGSLLFGLYDSRTLRYGRWPILASSCFLGCIAYVLTFLNLPADSPYEETVDTSIIHPSIPIALFCGAIFGLQDAAVNTQIYSLVSVMYSHSTPQAFAISKFFHALLSSVCMYYGNVLPLGWQLLLLCVGASSSAISFAVVERRFMIRQRSSETVAEDQLEMERKAIVNQSWN